MGTVISVLWKICSLCALHVSQRCHGYAKNCTSEEMSLLGLLELIMAIADHAPAPSQWRKMSLCLITDEHFVDIFSYFHPLQRGLPELAWLGSKYYLPPQNTYILHDYCALIRCIRAFTLLLLKQRLRGKYLSKAVKLLLMSMEQGRGQEEEFCWSP